MKIKTDIFAGMTFEQCDAERNWWKQQAQLMESYGVNKSVSPPAGLWFPCQGNPPYPGGGTTYPPTTGGGYVGGVWVADKSGYCV